MSPQPFDPHRRTKVVHVISGLNLGGAETMLCKLLSARSPSRPTEVVSLTDEGVFGAKIRALDVPVHALGMPRGRPSVGGLWRLVTALRREPPGTIVQCWMYHGNLVGGVAARLAGQRTVIWGIRSSPLDPARTSWMTLWTMRRGATFSRALPASIVYCSEVARDGHVAMGYAADKMLVIPNGFDTGRFRPDPAARLSVRQELGLSPAARLVGLFGRYDPQKDHATFIAAAGRAAGRHPDLHFVLCGENITPQNAALTEPLRQKGILERVHLLGRREDMPRLTAALDVATSSSAYGEAFPNVLGEAMACGVPCVATEVGDAALIIGATGRVVPPRDPAALAAGWSELLDAELVRYRELGEAARQRVRENFELGLVAGRYEALYVQLEEKAGDARQTS